MVTAPNILDRMHAAARLSAGNARLAELARLQEIETRHVGHHLGDYAAWHREFVGWPVVMEQMIELNERRVIEPNNAVLRVWRDGAGRLVVDEVQSFSSERLRDIQRIVTLDEVANGE